MPSITKQASGKWRALVRRKGQVISETFIRWDSARQWATEMEALIDSGQTFRRFRVGTWSQMQLEFGISNKNEFGHALNHRESVCILTRCRRSCLEPN